MKEVRQGRTMLKKLSRMMASGNDENFKCRKKAPYLKGAMFSVPSAAILDTKATGRGTIPLIMILYRLLHHTSA